MLAALACGSTTAQAGTLHEYTVTVDAELKRLDVEARFDGKVLSVGARSRRASRYLTDFRYCGADVQIRIRNRRLIVPAGGLDCMSYSVDLRAAAAAERRNRALDPANLVASSAIWLWRPAVSESARIAVNFRLPEGIDVSVPWQPDANADHRYLIGKSPESANAPIAFGQLDRHDIDVPGATLRVALLRGTVPMDNAGLLRWVEAAATDVSLAYEKFPNPSPQVLVIPVASQGRDGGSAVPYGRVVRDGGETVELLVNQHRPLEDFLDDWTATHEFSHLMLPYVARKHRWISEGFAQYYQNVLLARSGAYGQMRAWQKLYEGLERGRMSRPDLSPNDAATGGTRDATMKIYWSGAAIALMADVALREQSGGEQTLDDVLRELQACCLPSDRVWTGPELFAELDLIAGRDIFMPLYRRYANTIGFPDAMPVFARLGLGIEEGQVHLARTAQLGHIRSAITAVDESIRDWRQRLAASMR